MVDFSEKKSLLLGGVLLACAFSSSAMAQNLAEQMNCNAEGHGLRSLKSEIPTYIDIFNDGAKKVAIYWLNTDGYRVFYAYLAPGESYRQQTYVTHPWVFTTDPHGTCEAIYMPQENISVIKFK